MFKDHPVPTHCHDRGTFHWTRLLRTLIQTDLENFQGIHSFSGQPVSVPHHLHRKDFFSWYLI